jgi:hypothetical protein
VSRAEPPEGREKYRQRRRRPRPPRDDSGVPISVEIAEAFDLVPEIGEGWRWYDWPYLALSWLSQDWRRKLLPRSVLERLNLAINYLLPFNSHDRDLAWSLDDPHHNLVVPTDEHVNMPGIWVVELFPPTEIPALERAIARNKWDRLRLRLEGREGNQEMLERSRAGHGWTWWRIAELVSPDSRWFVPNAVRTELPKEFDLAEFRAIQVGVGLTAVIAEFRLTDEAATALDTEWHHAHEPQLVRRPGTRPRSLDRQWSAFRETQLVRKGLHDSARKFLASKLPGYFASNRRPQPLLDLLLLDKHDPTISHKRDLGWSDALRALGLSSHDIYHVKSPDLPKLLLAQVEGSLHEVLRDDPTWTLWGKRDAVVKALGEGGLGGYGSDLNRAIASRLVDNMYNLLVMLAVSSFLSISEEQYAGVRDRAGRDHGKFKPRALKSLRSAILTLSINLSSVHRDVSAFWKRKWRWEGDAEFTYNEAPFVKAQDKAAGRPTKKPINYNEELKKLHEEWFARLLESDRDYRDILSTVASLGASADSYKMGRLALWVAIASLTVAVAAVLVANLGENSLLGEIWRWLNMWFGS